MQRAASARTEGRSAAVNADPDTVSGFGDEWTRFDQSGLTGAERLRIFEEYFGIVPADVLHPGADIADFGVGSGRWAAIVAAKVGSLACVDASAEALAVARSNLAGATNCSFHHSTIEEVDLADNSLDFAYSLGVLHHIPDTRGAMAACVRKLKPGAPFLVYLYYRFDNKPAWYVAIWSASEAIRGVVSRAPHGLRYLLSQMIAVGVYWPLARAARLLELLGANVDNLPLAYYRIKPFYVLRTDALDRFGTRLEQRFTRNEISEMMAGSGLRDITFSDSPPYWCALGWKRDVD